MYNLQYKVNVPELAQSSREVLIMFFRKLLLAFFELMMHWCIWYQIPLQLSLNLNVWRLLLPNVCIFSLPRCFLWQSSFSLSVISKMSNKISVRTGAYFEKHTVLSPCFYYIMYKMAACGVLLVCFVGKYKLFVCLLKLYTSLV